VGGFLSFRMRLAVGLTAEVLSTAGCVSWIAFCKSRIKTRSTGEERHGDRNIVLWRSGWEQLGVASCGASESEDWLERKLHGCN